MWNPISVYIAKSLNRVNFHVPTPPNSDHRYIARKVLVIHCHPLEDSLSNAIAEAVVRGLKVGGHEHKLKHLCGSNNPSECYNNKPFPPALTAEERRGYYDIENVNKRFSGKLEEVSALAAEVKEAIEDLRWCDSVVFVFPIWWFSFPATLKGYFDRVMLAGVAFLLPGSSVGSKADAVGQTGLIGCLTNINKIGVVATSGSSWAVNMYAGRGPRQVLSRGFRALCAPDCQMTWHQLYSVSSRTEAERRVFLGRVEAAYAVF